MAIYHDQSAVYEVANIMAEECLIGDGSFFWPEMRIWTDENLSLFWDEFAGKPDEGSESFIVKWTNQLQGLPVDIFRLAYEVTALYCLFPSQNQFGPAGKRQLLDQVYNMGPELGAINSTRRQMLEDAISGSGIGMPGIGYLTNRPFHIGMMLAFAMTVKKTGVRFFADLQPKQTVTEALRLTSETMKHTPMSSLNILLHLFWPEQFEGIASADHKNRVAKGLSSLFNISPLDDVDEWLIQIRRFMEDEAGFDKDFNMYSDEVRPLWDSTLPSNVNRKFELAALFRERVLEKNSSFLWPESEGVWTPENSSAALDAIKHLFAQPHQQAVQSLAQLLEGVERPIYQILCDTRAALLLSGPLARKTAENEINPLLHVRKPFDGDQNTLEELLSSSTEHFPGINRGSGGIQMITRFIGILEGLAAIVAHPDTVGVRDQMIEKFLEKATYDDQKGFYIRFWTLLFLMYPDQFPSVSGWTSRQQIRQAFKDITANQQFPNEMAEVAFIREHLKPDFDPYTFDFFAEPWKSKWVLPNPPLPFSPTISDLAAATFLDEESLLDIENLLLAKKQLIFEGPPGSGKTFVAEKFARYFTGQSLADKRNEQVEMIQFHQSYGYEDFVEGIRPETNESGQLVYEVRPGIIRELSAKADLNPDKKFVLIIDEINRGNVSRVLGELMLLLEYRDQTAKLQYSKDEFQLPPNLYIIGTMNSADRSLSQIDYALRRRFYFVRFLSVEDGDAKVLRRWLRAQNLEPSLNNLILGVFTELNERLRKDLDTDDLQVGHSYLMDSRIGEDNFLAHIWKYSVIPLIREYLYHHRDRDELLQTYELQRLARIVRPIAEETGEPAARLINESVGEESE